MHALANLSEEGGYAVRHGTQFVSTFPNHDGENSSCDFSTCAFPTLFPFGVGGIEVNQKLAVPFMEHVQWCLQYHDQWFHLHNSFTFVTFGIQQRQEALTSAQLQMQHRDFKLDMNTLLALQPKDFQKASVEEKANVAISNLVVR